MRNKTPDKDFFSSWSFCTTAKSHNELDHTAFFLMNSWEYWGSLPECHLTPTKTSTTKVNTSARQITSRHRMFDKSYFGADVSGNKYGQPFQNPVLLKCFTLQSHMKDTQNQTKQVVCNKMGNRAQFKKLEEVEFVNAALCAVTRHPHQQPVPPSPMKLIYETISPKPNMPENIISAISSSVLRGEVLRADGRKPFTVMKCLSL